MGWGQGGLNLPPPVPFTLTPRPLPYGFPPLCFIYIVRFYAILQKFSFSPGCRHFGNPASRCFSSRLLYTSCPYSPGLPPPSTNWEWYKLNHIAKPIRLWAQLWFRPHQLSSCGNWVRVIVLVSIYLSFKTKQQNYSNLLQRHWKWLTNTIKQPPFC